MEFIGGSSLAPTESSTPQEIRFWGTSSHNILRRRLLPESYTVLSYEFDKNGQQENNRIGVYNNFAITNHHDDTHHYAFEISQLSSPSDLISNPITTHIIHDDNNNSIKQSHNHNITNTSNNLPPSASSLQLPDQQSISINNTIYPYYPLSTTHNYRPKQGPILLKLGLDPDLADIDLSLRIKDDIIIRGYCTIDHNSIHDATTIPQDKIDDIFNQHPLPINPHSNKTTQPSQQAINEYNTALTARNKTLQTLIKKHSLKNILSKDNISYGGDITYNGPTYSLGVKYNSLDNFIGCHGTKSFQIHSPSQTEIIPPHTKPIPNQQQTTSTSISINNHIIPDPIWLLPSSIDAGAEYFLKYGDVQDTFTIGTVATWNEYHQGLSIPNIKQWKLKNNYYNYDSTTSTITSSSISNHPSIAYSTFQSSSNSHSNVLLTPNENQHDIITASTLPTSVAIDVNGIGVIGVGFTTSLYDEIKRVSIPPIRPITQSNTIHAISKQESTTIPHWFPTTSSSIFNYGTPRHLITLPSITSDLSMHQLQSSSTQFSFLPTIISDLYNSIKNVFTTTTSFPLNIITPLFQLNTPYINDTYSQHDEIISHSSLHLGSKLEYSVGSRESGFQFGLQHNNHTFQRQYKQLFNLEPILNETTTTTTHHTTSSISNKSPLLSQTVVTPWYQSSNAQNSVSFSTTKGIGYDYTLEFSSNPQYYQQNNDISTINNNNISQKVKNIKQSRFYINFGLSKLLPFQYTEEFFRLHHTLPLLPMPHQPYTDIDATPCLQQHDNNGILSAISNISSQSWYPANYTYQPTSSNTTTSNVNNNNTNNTTDNNLDNTLLLDQSTSSILSTTSTNTTTSIQPQSITLNNNQQNGVNNDNVTRRLSLCSQNGEWKSISKTGATPSPIWNPFEGVKFNISFGFEM